MTTNHPAEISLRAASAADAAAIAAVMRASLLSHRWMPTLHTPEEDLAFVLEVILPQQAVTVAEAGGRIVGFIAVEGAWVEQLYLDPEWTGRGIGDRLLAATTEGLSEAKLFCFQANTGARRFYERHGFRAEAMRGGADNEEGLPDMLYVRRR